MQNITEDFLEVFLSQFSDHPDPISELPELGAVETSEPAEIKDMLPAGRSETGPVSNSLVTEEEKSGNRLVTDRWNFLMSERKRLLNIIKHSPITNRDDEICFVSCLELDEIHKELDRIMKELS